MAYHIFTEDKIWIALTDVTSRSHKTGMRLYTDSQECFEDFLKSYEKSGSYGCSDSAEFSFAIPFDFIKGELL